ncbi:uncharacterized protein SPPG_08574 [Spizellomyces punctatus DAOM BR117]|uniref:Uncharacterized protein n=1 Tax=Spizellomyces punctatus (strain DAOM BR117) TaxID=645134 RepID=A0A0L0H4S2_SPIPD|nr:uncharacterized protein SPPG_08574 [Spizellomyces punctatus DAOM BR117]KNC95969.1 hypothetical protein SPPG_08574 [Spizellomyces punctatus DAOM BR117]|eukprot:XP_016604009.1 hypothetical protein SPPG_08574 [Spizellomyces punctatus DAOM BR117]
MKFSESMEEFGFEVEVPNDQVEKFQKFFKGRTLAEEIDRLHGIDPLVTKWRDAKLQNLKKTMGTTLKDTDGSLPPTSPHSVYTDRSPVRSSLEVLESRFKALEQVGQTRDREVRAIHEQFAYLQTTMLQRFDDIQKRFQTKMEDAVWRKMQNVEKDIRASVQEDLAVLNLDPLAADTAKTTTTSPVTPVASPAPGPEKLKGGADKVESVLSALQTERDALKARADDAERRLAEAHDELIKLRAQLASTEEKVADMEKEGAILREVQEDRKALREHLNNVNEELAKFRAEGDALRIQLEALQTERDAWHSAANGPVGPVSSKEVTPELSPATTMSPSAENTAPPLEPTAGDQDARVAPSSDAEDPWREAQ